MASEASGSHHLPLAVEARRENKLENYDVFISHRGPDTKTGFVGFLYDYLKERGLRPYLDCKSIRGGEECWTSIEDAIKRTLIAVVVFSERYAESEWCLKELHLMLEAPSCKKILPIFYNVTPWDLRNPDRGQFKDGFEKLTKKFKSNLEVIEQWKSNLEVASKLMGWEHSNKFTRSSEVDLVKKVVERILEFANKSLPLAVCEHVVSVKQVAEELVDLHLSKKQVCALGLWGMGGIGKSTLAKELYNQLCKRFEASCFVEDVTEKIVQGQGVVGIQKRILKKLCSIEGDNDNKSELRPILEDRLSKKRILVVLDDVSDVDKLNDIMTRKMLRKGSVCIVTSRDKRVFEASNIFEPIEREVFVHEVELLNSQDSKRVFTSFAFGRDCDVPPKYEDLVTKISELCCGVPLVLKVCGALLKGEVYLEVWEDVKRKLDSGAIMDHKNIFNCLRMSYDFLEEKEKMMFLDIACAFLGRFEDMAICTWRSQGWQPHLGVRNLKKKALISVDEEGCFTMHDHLRDMGREIERVEAKDDIRRLWMPTSLSLWKKGEPWPHSLETLVITLRNRLDITHRTVNLAFNFGMKNLRILLCEGPINLTSIPEHLRCLLIPNAVGYGCTTSNFPNVPKENQLACMYCSCILRTYYFWEGFGRLTRLESLDIAVYLDKRENVQMCKRVKRANRCKRVVDFEGLYKLRYVSLRGNFVKIISGFSSKHSNLRSLQLTECDSLQSCPSVGNLSALEDLLIFKCNLKELPNLQQLTRLRKLHIDECDRIVAVSGLEDLVALEEFTTNDCSRLVALPNMHKLTNLRVLELNDCGSIKVPQGLCKLISLHKLSIAYEDRQGIFDIHKLNNLVDLDLDDWNGRAPLHCPDVMSLEHLHIQTSGTCIEVMPNLINAARLQSVELSNCHFEDVSCLGTSISLRRMSISYCYRLEVLPDLQKLTRLECLKVVSCPKAMVWGDIRRRSDGGTPNLGDQPGVLGTSTMALQSLGFWYVGCRELPDLSLFPALKELTIKRCLNLERVVSTRPMTALEMVEIEGCKKLQEVPHFSHSKLLGTHRIINCEKLYL